MTDEIANKIAAFFDKYRVRTFEKGQILILNGDKPDGIFHLKKGRVKQYDITYRGDEVILNIFKPPAFFPMSLALTDIENKFIYEADTDIEVCQAPVQDAVQFLKDNPDVLFDLLARVYKGTEGMLGRMSYLMASSASSRLIYELIIEARRFGQTQKDGSCILNIYEKDLGARAGLSRETVSREFRKLKAAGWVEVRPKDIMLKNLAALEEKLGQEI
jgi:CRP-like cAMP-binding protein